MISASAKCVDFDFWEGCNDQIEVYREHCLPDGTCEIAIGKGSEVVVFRRNGQIVRRISVNFEIVDVLWFPCCSRLSVEDPGEKIDYLTLVGKRELVFYQTEDDHPFYFSFPFKINAVYPANDCLIIERCSEHLINTAEKSDDSIYLYSLTHPLDELRPIIYRDGDLTNFFMLVSSTKVGGCFGSCILIYDDVKKAHVLYNIRKATADDCRMITGTPRIFPERHKIQPSPKTSTPVSRGPMPHLPSGRTTRSMRRLERTRNFHMDSPALSAIGTPLSQNKPSFRDSTISFRLRAVSHHSMNELHLTRVLEREFDNDLLYAEFCFECVWIEPRRDESSYPASRAFLSKSFIGHTYMNYVIRPPEGIKSPKSQLRSIRLIEVEKSYAVSGNLSSVECVDAIALKDFSTLVLFNYHISIYSGVSRTTDVFITSPSMGSIQWNRAILLPSAHENTFSVIANKSIYQLTIPPMYNNKQVELLFTTISETLPQDKAMRLAGEWRSHTPLAIQKRSVCSSVHNAYQFLLKHIGFDIPLHPKMRTEALMEENDETQAKQRRPLRSSEQNWRQLCAFGTEGAIDISSDNDISVTVNSSAVLYSNVYPIFGALHAHWENMLLDRGQKEIRAVLVYYLYALAKLLKLDFYASIYEKAFPICKQYRVASSESNPTEFPSPHGIRNFNPNRALSIWSTVDAFINNRSVTPLPLCVGYTAKVLLAIGIGVGRIKTLSDIQRFVGKNWIRRLKLGEEEQAKFLEKFLNVRESLASKCVSALRSTGIGLPDVENFPTFIALLIGKIIHVDHTALDAFICRSPKIEISFPTEEEFDMIASARWPTDIRWKNAGDMLDSSRPVLINTDSLGLVDPDLREAQELFLSGSSIRYLTQSLGRAFFDFRTSTPSPSTNIAVPDLCLTARLFPSNLSFEIPISDALRPFREWGEFYNGVATALKMADASQVKVEGEWIMAICNNNDKLTPATKAGLLYGFGLNGHIVNANMFDVHDLLAAVEDFQSVALILGYAASRIGTNDSRVFRMITTQLPFLMGPTLLPIMITPLIQTASISAIGLVFAESGHLNITKKLVNEIGRSSNPEDIPSSDRYAYKLSAGFSVGLICLSLGNQMMENDPCFQEPQPSVIKRLIMMMNGGPRDICVYPQNSNSNSEYVQSGVNQFTPEPSSHVWEKENINTHLTSHPATVALGLMFFQTNNTYMADMMALPQTISLLEGIRPDLVLVRVLCKNLILWDSIQISEEWVESQIPEVVSRYMKKSLKWKDPNAEYSILVDEEDKYWDGIVDRETLAQVYLYAITGAAMSLAFKYIAHPRPTKMKVLKVLDEYMDILTPSRTKKKMNTRLTKFAGNNVVSLCMNTMLICYSLLSSGEGDIQALRVARMWRMQGNVLSWSRNIRKHQEQLAAHQAIGILFMGNGSCGFKDDKLSIALLLISFYPIVCHNITDNRFYHQPLRFLWVRAVEQRLLIPVSAHSQKPLRCEVKLYYKDMKVPHVETGPVLLPNLDYIDIIEIGGQNNELIRINLKSANERKALEQTLSKNFGRIKVNPSDAYQLEVYGKDWFERGWSIENLVNGKNCQPSDDQNAFVENLIRLTDPLEKDDKANMLRWQSLESIPSMAHHLRNCQTSLVHAKEYNNLSTDIEMVQAVADWSGESQLAYQLELELSKLQERLSCI